MFGMCEGNKINKEVHSIAFIQWPSLRGHRWVADSGHVTCATCAWNVTCLHLWIICGKLSIQPKFSPTQVDFLWFFWRCYAFSPGIFKQAMKHHETVCKPCDLQGTSMTKNRDEIPRLWVTLHSAFVGHLLSKSTRRGFRLLQNTSNYIKSKHNVECNK